MSDGLNNLSALLDSLTEEIDNTSIEFDEFGNTLSRQEAKAKQIENARYAAIEKRIAKEEEEFKKKVQRYNEMSKFAVDTAANMTTQEGAFSTLSNVAGMAIKGFGSLLGSIPVVGSAIKGLSEGVAESVKLIAGETAKAFQTFGKLSDTGIVSNFENMKEAARNTGLLFGELNGVLAKNSEALAILGGNAISGSKSLQNILKINNVSSEQYAEQFQKIGINFAEFSEIQASYVTQQIRAGFLKGKSDEFIARSARQYVEDLDTLSKLTGKQRAEIQKEQEKLQSDARFRAYLAELESQGPEGQQKAETLKQLYSVVGDGAKQGLMDIIVSGGAITSDAAAQVAIQFGQGGLDVVKFAKDFNRGEVTIDNAMTQLTTAADNYTKEMAPLTAVIGAGSDISKGFVNMANLARFANKNFTEIKKLIEDERKAAMLAADPMAQAGKKSHDIARGVEDLLTRSDGVPAAMNAMASGALKLGELVESIITKFGGTVTDTNQTSAETSRLGRQGTSSQDLTRARMMREETEKSLKEATEERERLEKEQGKDSEAVKKARIDEMRKREEAQKATMDEMSAGRKKYGRVTLPSLTPSSETAASQAGNASATLSTQTGATGPLGETSQGTDGAKIKLPASIKKILDFIGNVESNGDYNVLVGGKKDINGNPVTITDMTIREILSLQNTMQKLNFQSTAVGKYQIIKDTLWGLVQSGNIPLTSKFDSVMQDKLAETLLMKRGYQSFAEGKLDAHKFADNLAMEWASLPFSNGKSYYQGVGSNKSLVDRSTLISILSAANGALVKPSLGGTLAQVAEAGQPEAIIPMLDGRTIPVNITNSDNSAISNIFDTINLQVEQIADLLMRGNSIEDNLAQIMA